MLASCDYFDAKKVPVSGLVSTRNTLCCETWSSFKLSCIVLVNSAANYFMEIEPDLRSSDSRERLSNLENTMEGLC